MVNFLTKKYYKCARCSFEHEDEDIVIEHMSDHVEEPIERYNELFQCSICNMEYEKITEADKCEEEHKTGNDKKYQAFKIYMEQQELYLQGNKDGQKKLI